MSVEISEHQQAKAALQVAEAAQQESDRRSREMLEKVQLVVVMLDADGHVTFCNDYLLRLTGWTRQEALGSDWFSRFLPPGSDAVRNMYFDSMRAGADAGAVPYLPSYENPIITKAGELRPARGRLTDLPAPRPGVPLSVVLADMRADER